MAMTKKDFVVVAEALQNSRLDYSHNDYETQLRANAVIDVVAGRMEEALRMHCANFNPSTFRAKVM